jgi:hypothetical protein
MTAVFNFYRKNLNIKNYLNKINFKVQKTLKLKKSRIYKNENL